jgi:hypothetical protein
MNATCAAQTGADNTSLARGVSAARIRERLAERLSREVNIASLIDAKLTDAKSDCR